MYPVVVFSSKRSESRNASYCRKYNLKSSRAFSTWLPLEDLELRSYFLKDKLPIEEIAKLHDRSIPAIHIRLKYLKLI